MNGKKILEWAPRALLILFILFMSMFAFDATGWGLVMHLIPSMILIATLVAAWYKPLYGGIAIIVLGLISIFFFKTYREIISFFLISFPFIVCGGLFIWQHCMREK